MNKNLKSLIEKKNDYLVKMEELTGKAITEERAFTEEESSEFDKMEREVRALSETLERCRKDYEREIEAAPQEERARIKKEEAEERAFEKYIRSGGVITEEMRADGNFTKGENGAVIPSSIVNKIFEEVKERSNIYREAEIYHAKGTLSFPVYKDGDDGIKMAYQEEFSELTATNGKFEQIELKGYTAAALAKVPRSLLNNSQFSLLPFIVGRVGKAVADFIEKEIFNGTEEKITGLSKVEEAAKEVTADSLITLQDSVPQSFQKNCHWIMNSKTKDKIRKFKTTDGDYYLVRDYSNDGYNWTLLGKGVELTDAVKDDVIYYGDYSGLKIKVAEDPNIQILNEVFATQHAIGVVAWCELDANVVEPQKIKCIKPQASEAA